MSPTHTKTQIPPTGTTQVTERGFGTVKTQLKKVANAIPPQRNARKGRHEEFSKPSEEPKKVVDAVNTQNTLISKSGPLKKVGKYRLGPKQGSLPVKCIQQYLARKEGSDDFYIIKMLKLKGKGEIRTTDDIQGTNLLHTEHSLSSLLSDEPGVVHEHEIFRDTEMEEYLNEKNQIVTREVNHLCLVLDCYVPHDFSPKYTNITNMQLHVIKEKKLPETEAIRIFYKVVQIVERLHKQNVVHRDLKLGNIIFNKGTNEVKLANFCLGKHLSSENDPLKDQRGSPAYISPDVISGKPYLGKPSDMWALGVVLYTMLYGQFPFYDQSPTELFRKIKIGEFQIPTDSTVSQKTVQLIKSLLNLDAKKRFTASQVLKEVRSIITTEHQLMSDSDLQVVPDCHPGAERPKKRPHSDRSCTLSDNAFADIAALLAKTSYDEVEPSDPEIRDNTVLEPYRKMAKRIVVGSKVQIPGVASYITLDELQRIHAMYVTQKLQEAAKLGKISATFVSEDVANHLTGTSSNGFNQNATTNLDSAACVPDCCNNVNVMNPTKRIRVGEQVNIVS